MKRILLALSATLATLSFGVSAHAQGIASCSTTISLPNREFIYKNSAPTRVGGPGTPLTGYRRNPTLIMGKLFSRATTTIYDTQDNVIGTCPWATAHGEAGGRFRCTMPTAALRRKAIKNTGSAGIYFVLNKKTKACAYVPDAGKCYGSVKGLCNQIIK